MYRFEEYDLIIDARCEREFAEDHIPGAINRFCRSKERESSKCNMRRMTYDASE
ncbi:rhodanese-like domain-containing protein [Paraburkholderia sp. EG304]|uniref:rhodanese-like domain-containing protein n=1 Tax=Paraburkholderia sp. EG304 TaxID=3237015 RepID=UPI003979AEFC